VLSKARPAAGSELLWFDLNTKFIGILGAFAGHYAIFAVAFAEHLISTARYSLLIFKPKIDTMKKWTLRFALFCGMTLAFSPSFAQQNFSVTVQSNTFTPQDLTITAGDTVTWTNIQGSHNVNGSQTAFPSNPESFGNGPAAGAPWTYAFVFNTPGLYNYRCDPHAALGMTGTVTVEAAAEPYPEYAIGQVNTVDAEGVADSLDVACTLRGIVYGINLRTNGLQFTIIDEMGDGIVVFNNAMDFGYTVQEGDEVRVQGVIDQFNGLQQIIAEDVELLSTGNPLLDPEVVTQLGEETESRLVKIENVSLVDPAQWTSTGTGFNVDVTDGLNTYVVRISNRTDIYNLAPPTGVFDITGLGGQFDNSLPYTSGYQLLPRYVADIDPYDPGTPAFPEYAIGQVNTVDADGVGDSLGVACALRGIVYGINFRANGLQFVIIDELGDGIGVFNNNMNFGYTVQEGDEVRVQGVIDQFNGLLQIVVERVELLSTGNPLLDPVVVTQLGEETESNLIKIENVSLVDPAQWLPAGGGFNVEVSDGANTYTVRISNRTDIFSLPPPTGVFDITGLGGQFDNSLPYTSGYQLFPRYAADIDPYNVPEPSFPLYSIGEVRGVDAQGVADSLNVSCELRGIVYGVNLRPQGLQFTIIDGQGDGIGVFNSNRNFGYTVQEGDEIAVQGTIGQFNGLTQIGADTVWQLSTGNTLLPATVVTALGEETESRLVRIENLTLVNPSQWNPSGTGFNVEVTNGSTIFQMRVSSATDLFNEPAPSGTFNLTGIGSQFDNSQPFTAGYQILPRYKEDIEPASSVLSPALGERIAFFPNPAREALYIRSQEQLDLVRISALSGQKAAEWRRPDQEATLDVSALPSGVYLISFVKGHEIWAAELIKQ
jgi:plastocyanin/DNA/RNA endonuclease YhcR with UshA esterase domain